MRLHYAYDIAAAAFMSHLPEDDDDRAAFIERLMSTVLQGWQHTVLVIHVLSKYDLLPRFRG